MLQNDDLDAAIGAGILTQAQADGLLALMAQRRSGTAALRADEERFRFMRGFNDFFFAIGVVLLGVGISMFAGLNERPAFYAIAAAIMWALAELLVRRMRLVLPGIVILIFFIIFAMAMVPIADIIRYAPDIGEIPTTLFFNQKTSLRIAIQSPIAMLAAALFYFRFRFPFALLISGASIVLAIAMSANTFVFKGAELPLQLILLACGIVAFAAAMRFDLSDRLRATRRSDCAFWLHVLAAPLIVHSLMVLIISNTLQLDIFSSVRILAIAGLLTIVALVIDRRALLVSALSYIGIVIANTLSHAGTNEIGTGIATLVILGILVLALGIGWTPLRRRIASYISPALMNRLPPVVPA
jgi:hypothetical protein